jgi:fucose 4-O-acetylase-like acetyltransferase
MTGPSQRYHSLDLLRAVMMALGIIFHGAQMYYRALGAEDYYRDPMRSLSMDAILIYTNTFRMPVFFMLSGFFAALLATRRGVRGMLGNRFQRIVLPFLVFLPVTVAVMTPLTVLGANVLATGEWGFDFTLVNQRELRDKTHNLWFLYYLAMFIAVSALARPALDRLSQRLQEGAVAGVPMVLLFAVLLALLGSMSDSGRVGASLSFIPSPKTFAWFLLCYLYGWLLWSDQASIAVMARQRWRWFWVAHIGLLIALAGFVLRGDDPTQTRWMLLHGLLSLATGVSVMGFVLFFTGLFERRFGAYSRRGRYFSDSAYWVFVCHSFFLVAFAIPMAHLEWPAEIKFLIVCGATGVACWLTYDIWVRPTWLGQLLNGKRMPSALKGRNSM